MNLSPRQFQKLILHWFDQHGRKELPWQHNKTAYRVWISEIMLQQTQVNTVIPYFERFMQRFPNLSTLAAAKEDEVLHIWTGLGYYSRARNLLRAAKMIMQEFDGKFPDNAIKIQQLPGIGPSTAGAILAIAFEQSSAILDGNVKRVLTRLHAITDPVNEKKVENTLWELAKYYTPNQRVSDYTQAMMDFGATLCTRTNPQCDHCPFRKHCLARKQGRSDQLPVSKKTQKLPIRTTTFVILKQDQQMLLEKRPSPGIWGGLWCFPELPGELEVKKVKQFCQQHFQLVIREVKPLPFFRHTFSHYHLDIHPIIIFVKKRVQRVVEECEQIWYNPDTPVSIGLPKPVQRIMGLL